jgi:PilZ domain
MSDDKREPAGFEKRKSPRRPGNFSATIILDNGERIRCIVKDFSKYGVLLVVPTVLGIPLEFNLQAATGQVRRVRVQRRGTSRLGVMFV